MVKIIKRKVTGFFDPEDLKVIRQAVLEHNELITKISMLARAYYIFQMDNNVPDNQLVLDTYMKSRTYNTLKKRRKSGLEEYETSILNQYPKKSCNLETFCNYCSKREDKRKELENVYSNPYFRESKFTTYCKTKSSEHKFIDKIVTAFTKPNNNYEKKNCLTKQIKENALIDCETKKNIVIAWGNWGKKPNALKNGAPTPGIGIRERFEKFFTVKVVCEHLTSQTCPCCRKEKTMENPEIKDITRHHLLRCTNDCKSSWWNRNVLGSYNILVKAFGLANRINYQVMKPLVIG